MKVYTRYIALAAFIMHASIPLNKAMASSVVQNALHELKRQAETSPLNSEAALRNWARYNTLLNLVNKLDATINPLTNLSETSSEIKTDFGILTTFTPVIIAEIMLDRIKKVQDDVENVFNQSKYIISTDGVSAYGYPTHPNYIVNVPVKFLACSWTQVHPLILDPAWKIDQNVSVLFYYQQKVFEDKYNANQDVSYVQGKYDSLTAYLNRTPVNQALNSVTGSARITLQGHVNQLDQIVNMANGYRAAAKGYFVQLLSATNRSQGQIAYNHMNSNRLQAMAKANEGIVYINNNLSSGTATSPNGRVRTYFNTVLRKIYNGLTPTLNFQDDMTYLRDQGQAILNSLP
jgi:hypothetical protein